MVRSDLFSEDEDEAANSGGVGNKTVPLVDATQLLVTVRESWSSFCTKVSQVFHHEDQGEKQSDKSNNKVNVSIQNLEREQEDRWSRRNLFAIFVLIPLIVLLLGSTAWSAYQHQSYDRAHSAAIFGGESIRGLLFAVPSYLWSCLPDFSFGSGAIDSSPFDNNFDMDRLIAKILEHDKFNELMSSSPGLSDGERLKWVIQSQMKEMQNELKAKAEASHKDLTNQFETVKKEVEAKFKTLGGGSTINAQSNSLNEIQSELASLRQRMERLSPENDDKKREVQDLTKMVDELTRKHEELNAIITNCKSEAADLRSEIETKVTTILAEILNEKSAGLVTKEDLSARIKEATTSFKDGVESDVLDRVRSDPAIMAKLQAFASQQSSYSKEDVFSIVHEALNVYDADKTGLFDFALESAGGTIASIRCTEPYDVTQAVYHVMGIPVWWERQKPTTILQPGSSPGQCWAFKGSKGQVVVRLSNEIAVNGVTLEHIPRSLSPDGSVSSAPKQFEVLGLRHLDDPDPVVLGNLTYNANDSNLNHVQTFSLVNPERVAFDLVELKVLSNHGNSQYTCIYRFRVHGELQDNENNAGDKATVGAK